MKLNPTNTILASGVVFASLVVLLRRIWLMELDSFEFDDAFMFIRYAENILAGNGYAWNADDGWLFGNTSILFTYLVAINKAIFGNVLSNSWVLISTTSVFTFAFLFVLQRGLYRQVESSVLKQHAVLALITIPFLTLPLILGFHIGTGMETTTSLFFNTAFIFATLNFYKSEDINWKSIAAVAFLGYACFLCRPDNALFVALFPTVLLLSAKKNKHLLYLVAALGSLILIDVLVKYLLFGSVLPLSFYAKKSGFTEGYTAKYFWNPVKYITQMVAYLMPFILLIFAFARRKYAGLILAFLLPLLLTVLYYFTFDQIMGFNARLYFPFTPYVLVLAILLLDKYLQSENKLEININNFTTRMVFLLVFLFFMVFSKYRFITKYEQYAIAAGNKNAIPLVGYDDRKYNREASIKIISKLLKEFPDDLVFAATEHGFIAGDNPKKKIVDLSGLHNKTIALEGYNDGILENTQPDFIWLPHQDLTVLHHEITSGDYFQNNYDLIKNVFAFGCAIRKDSPYYEQLKSSIR